MTRCGMCNGSGYLAGTYGDLLCPDCGGACQWETEETVVPREPYVPSAEYLAWCAEIDARRTEAMKAKIDRRAA